MVCDEVDVIVLGEAVGGGPTTVTGAAVVAAAPKRTLDKKSSRERSPRRLGAPSPSPRADAFAPGQAVLFHSLGAKPEINGEIGKVVRFDAAKGRYVVAFRSEELLVREVNLRLSIFQQS